MTKRLVIVESPTKARTIEKFLGKDFEVTASYGHIRDLPDSAAEIPEAVKKEKWSRLGVNVDAKFEPLYIIPEDKKKRVKELKDLLKEADELLLATDEDREGESISWHLVEVLKPKIPTKRLVFHEITKEAIQESLTNARDIDESMVRAQETRRIVDRLFGYSVSPLLWKKMAPRLSAGRVQSVALRLLVERERERMKFRAATYWDLAAIFSKKGKDEKFEAELTHFKDKRVASGRDFDPNTGKLTADSEVVLLGEADATKLREALSSKDATVLTIEEKPYTTKPYPPFTTSTIQQEGSRKLGLSARQTMSLAQTLYENGFITYMRTDSTFLSEEGLNGARAVISREMGAEYLHPEPRIYKTKVRNAQEAHEAIRPAGVEFASPETVRAKLGLEPFKLYELIWKRTLASQMKDSTGIRVGVTIGCGDARFRAAGKTITFAGFLRAYVEGADDPDAELADREKILPALKEGETLSVSDLQALSHTTQPPPRFTEGSLIKELERLGIGRPSTWATIVGVVLSRDYAFKKGGALVPTFLAQAVIGLMERYFTNLMDYEFTARLEDDLDAISRGEADNLKYLDSFYFGNGHPGLKKLVETGEATIDPRDVCGLPIGRDEQDRVVEVRIGRYGPFISNGETRAGLPDGVAPDEMNMVRAKELLEAAARGPESLGPHPETGLPIYLKNGRFGPYIQMGDQTEGGDKPKMASLLPGMEPGQVTFDAAVQILSLPRNLGKNPENNEDILAANGRYGPYIKCGADTRSISEPDSPITITLERALEILKEPKRRKGQAAPKNLKSLGKHPVSEKELHIRNGRFGPYVTDGTINASLHRGMSVETLTLEDAISLLAARELKIAEGGGGPRRRGSKAKTKSAAPKKEGAKKATKGSKKNPAAANES